MLKIALPAALVSVALGLAVVAAAHADPAPSPTAPAKPAIVVHIAQFKYAPDPVTVNAGDSVRFVNDDPIAHTATAVDKSFDTGNLDQGKSATVTFSKAGTYDYLCTYHTYMTSKVIVKPAAQ